MDLDLGQRDGNAMNPDKNGPSRPEINPRAWTRTLLRKVAGVRALVQALAEEVDELGREVVRYIHGDTGNHDQRERQPGQEGADVAEAAKAPQDPSAAQIRQALNAAPWKRRPR